MNKHLNDACPFEPNTPEYKLYFEAYSAHVAMDSASNSLLQAIEDYNKHRTRALAYGRALDILCDHDTKVYAMMPDLPDVSPINYTVGK